MPSGRLTIQAAASVTKDPDEAFQALARLLNTALVYRWPDSDWIISIMAVRRIHTFEQDFRRMSLLTTIEIEFNSPNSSSHAQIQDLARLGVAAGGDTFKIRATGHRGLDKQSDLVQSAVSLLRQNLARVLIIGVLDGKPGVTVPSDGRAEVVSTQVATKDGDLRALDGTALLKALDEQDEAIDQENRKIENDTGEEAPE